MKQGRFPQRIKSGSSVVTIYRTPHKGYVGFTVIHYDASGTRCRRTFADYRRARSTAEETAQNLARGRMDMLVLTGQELLIYRRAMEAVQVVGAKLDVAAIQFAQSVQNSNDVAGSVGCRNLSHADLPATKPKLVAEVVSELLTAKKDKGRSELYLTDLRVRLARFAKALPRPLCEIASDDIDRFLKGLAVSARSQNNFRATIGTLLRFAQARGYVTRDHPGVSHVEKVSQTTKEILVFSPDEIHRLLQTAKDELVPALAIGAFGGVRSQELKRLHWGDLKFRQGHIEIKGAKAKTGLRRLIPLQRNLKAWLLPFVKDEGPITPFANLAHQFDKLAKKTGVKWKKNGLRHSFISYRTALTANVAAVSLEAGNSPQVIARNYLKCVTRAEARRWFGVYPH